MGSCDSSLETLRNSNSKFSVLQDKTDSISDSSSSLPNLSIENQYLKKYNSVEETNSIQNKQYILPERIAKREDITKKYKISQKILGDGATSLVYLAENSSKKKFAIKRIAKEKIEVRKKIILKEAEICIILNNKNVIK